MPSASDALPLVYTQAWIALGLILAYYILMTAVLRWRPQRRVTMARYEPPHGISPAIAAYLVESGRCERAFAAALVSLAAKGFLTIQQDKELFTLQKRREPDASLPAEEFAALEALLPGSLHTWTFDSLDFSALLQAYDKFEEAIKSDANPQLLSPHLGVWVSGIGSSLAIILFVVTSLPLFENSPSLASLPYVGIFIVFGGICFVAALHVWPSTIRKLTSFLPGDARPSRPLDANDAIPLILTAAAFVGFGFLASMTSTRFALLLTAVVFLNTLFRHLLQAPTRAGRKVLAELADFREFLARVHADRLTRLNQSGRTPQTLEAFSGYAIALDVEHSWGEDFSNTLLELLEIERAYHPRYPNSLDTGGGRIDLKL